MTGRILAFVGVTFLLATIGWIAVGVAGIGSCGLGPDAMASCYEAQRLWVFLTIAAFGMTELLAFHLFFLRRHRGSHD